MPDLSRLVDPKTYASEAAPYELYRELRRHSPVQWVEAPDYRPFWAISRAEDIQFIERASDKFLAGPRTVMLPITSEVENLRKFGYVGGVRALTHMDAGMHQRYRALTRDFFSPRSIAQLEENVRATARQFVDRLQAHGGGTIDFAADIAFWYPLRVIMQQLGVPAQDEPELLRMTQALFGAEDADFGDSNLTPGERLVQVVTEMNAYFGAMVEDRRRNPRQDIATILATATIDGAPLDPMNLLSYFIIVATAGHDTTSATIAGGLKALMENPDQLALLREQPQLMPKAVNEMLRWVAPVKHFVRTAVQDVEIGGQRIETNDAVMLLFASACRDEAVFADADRFRIDRDPNQHLAFGFGPHVCLGMHLARLEIAAFFQELLPRIKHVEAAGNADYVESIFVSGLKRFPVRIDMA